MAEERYSGVSEFLEYGVTTTLPENDSEACAICRIEYTSAVRIKQCGHCFDLDCLAMWFRSKSKPNTCPMCRVELFGNCALAAVTAMFGRPDFQWDDFDIPNGLDGSVPRVVPVEGGGSLAPILLLAPEQATTRIDIRMMRPALVLAANIAVVVDGIQGNALDEEELAGFRQIVKAMHFFLASRDGEKMQVRSLPMEILLGTMKILNESSEQYDIDSIWPDDSVDILDLGDDPARRAVHLSFFVSWVMWKNSEDAPT